MDTVTHALVGAALSDCWFRKRLGPVATPFALAAAALPDIDSVTFLISAESAWAHHRGITHGFFPMLLAAPLLGYLGWCISERRERWLLWSLLALLCLYSHTLLDLVTSWGTMPLLPFSNARVSWDVAPVLDAFVFSTTAASFVAIRVLRWERVDTFLNPLVYPVVHRHPGRQKVGDWMAKIVVALVVCYLLVGWQQNRQTVRIAREALKAQGITVVEVRALPIMFTYIAWDIAARDVEGNVYNAVHSSYAPGTMRFVKYETLPRDAIAPELSSPDGRLFTWYSQNMYVARRDEEKDGSGISLHDRRFFSLGQPERSAFVMRFPARDAAAPATLRGAVVQRGFAGIDIRDELRRLWELTWRGVETPAQEAGEQAAADR